MTESRQEAVQYWLKMAEESLASAQQEGDYLAFSSFEGSYVDAQLKRGAQFLNQLRALITSPPSA
jgi:hypothetical protein